MSQRLNRWVRQKAGAGVTLCLVLVWLGFFANHLNTSEPAEADLERGFTNTVRPFVETYCITCDGREKPKADFDLSPYSTMSDVVRDHLHCEMDLEKLQAAEMPPAKAKQHPTAKSRQEIIAWIQSFRRFEARNLRVILARCWRGG